MVTATRCSARGCRICGHRPADFLLLQGRAAFVSRIRSSSDKPPAWASSCAGNARTLKGGG
eukprot:358002-Chlamydomonas_euryale.AAC.3